MELKGDRVGRPQVDLTGQKGKFFPGFFDDGLVEGLAQALALMIRVDHDPVDVEELFVMVRKVTKVRTRVVRALIECQEESGYLFLAIECNQEKAALFGQFFQVPPGKDD